MSPRDTITVSADDMEAWVHEAALAGRTYTIEFRADHAELRVGSRVFRAPLPLVPAQLKPGVES